MIRGKIQKTRARPAPYGRPMAGVMVRAAVTVLAGLAVTVATAAVPALAAPHQSQGPEWAKVAAGLDDTCAIRTDGTLWCWGDNFYGDLGIGNYTNEDRPQQVTSPAAGGWASVTAGNYYTCATRTDRTLWCWGLNAGGSLGIHSHIYDVDLPHQVTTRAAAGGWTSVSAGGSTTCATRLGGSLWCWGLNESGQLGIGNTVQQDVPRQVTSPAVSGWASVTVGYFHACATRTGGTLWCWGANNYGQLGIGNDTNPTLPQQVTTPATTGWASVTGGGYHTCASRTDTTLWCWGDNRYGQLGLGNQVSQELPQQVTTPATTGWARVTAGFFHTCASRTDTTLWCWGDNYWGELGIGHHPDQHQPAQVTTPGPHEWASVRSSGQDTCAIRRTGGTLWCWGDAADGVLGIGPRPSQYRPQQVTIPS